MSRLLHKPGSKFVAEIETNSENKKTDTSWYLYIIEADDHSLYTGITTDVCRRFEEHRSSGRGARYFNGRKPLAVVYLEECVDRAGASRREYEIKSLSAQKKRQLVSAADPSVLTHLNRQMVSG